jgi:ribosome biogenesis GTPase
VKEALASGELPQERFASYKKQLRELAAIARKKDKRLANQEAKKWKSITKAMKGQNRMR